MLRPIDQWFMDKDEPVKGCLGFLRDHILHFDHGIKEVWQYRMPFYCIGSARVAYLWVHRKYGQPYLGLVEGTRIVHPDLLQEKRSRMKILLIDPAGDIPLEKINGLLKTAIGLTGVV